MHLDGHGEELPSSRSCLWMSAPRQRLSTRRSRIGPVKDGSVSASLYRPNLPQWRRVVSSCRSGIAVRCLPAPRRAKGARHPTPARCRARVEASDREGRPSRIQGLDSAPCRPGRSSSRPSLAGWAVGAPRSMRSGPMASGWSAARFGHPNDLDGGVRSRRYVDAFRRVCEDGVTSQCNTTYRTQRGASRHNAPRPTNP